MKTYITILTFFLNYLCFSQQESTIIHEKTYHSNGKIEIEYERDSILHSYVGFYREYDTSGVLIVEGNYKFVDSVQCKNCYEGQSSWESIPSRWEKYEYEKLNYLKVGTWNYYYPNGQLKMSGKYSSKIHSHCGDGSLHKVNDGPVNVYIQYDFLKNEIWAYYNESGTKTKIEEYIDGELIYTIQ